MKQIAMKNIRHHIEIHFLSSRLGSVNIAQTIATCIYAHCLKVLLYESELKIYFFTNFYQRSFWTNTKKNIMHFDVIYIV